MSDISEKNYNPFRMWGSYFFIHLLIFSASGCNNFLETFNLGGPSCRGTLFVVSQFISLPMFIPVLISEGIGLSSPFIMLIAILSEAFMFFMIGWGVHSFFRKIST